MVGGSEHVPLLKVQKKNDEYSSMYLDNSHPVTEGNEREEVKLTIFGASIGQEATSQVELSSKEKGSASKIAAVGSLIHSENVPAFPRGAILQE